MRRVDLRGEQGVMMVLFGIMLPLFLILTAIAWDAGNWWVHRRHLQTKVDAAALAGGGVWQFPCSAASDTNVLGSGIIDVARKYAGQHIEADGTPYTSTSYNPQVGGTPYTQIHVVLNGNNWYDSDLGLNPADKSGQPNPAGTICDSSFLDVKATEQNNTPLFGWIPFKPSLKRRAKVEIQQIEGLRGLLPIGVRVPKPLTAAAVFYNEANGNIEAVKYFREICISTTPCDSSIPAGLGQWTTLDPTGGNWAQFTPTPNTGVVIATSFRPACNSGTVPAGVVTGAAPCMEDTGFTTVNQFCDQVSGAGNLAPVKCEDANGTGASQTVVAGLQFMRSYAGGSAPPNSDPELRSAYLDSASNACSPVTRQAYFNAGTVSGCTAILHVRLDLGSVLNGPPPNNETRTVGNTKVTYKIISDGGAPGPCNNWTNNGCDLAGSGGPGGNTDWVSGPIPFNPSSARTSIVLRVRIANTTVAGYPTCTFSNNNPSAQCQFFYTAAGKVRATEPGGSTPDAYELANPVQRAFMGDINKSGPVKWLRLTADTNCDGVPDAGLSETGPAASVQSGGCNQFFMTMGLQGGLAKDQDEPPIQLNIGATSQSSLIDCDPNISTLKDEIQQGCQDPPYARNNFNTSPLCPPDTPGQFWNSPKSSPFNPPDNYPPWRCVLTQTTAAPSQILSGFDLRLFNVQNNPTCPADSATQWVKGRNYWHNANNLDDDFTFADDRVAYGVTDPDPSDNLPNRLKTKDPRLVTLFFTPYDSFTGSGNEIYPVAGFGSFYITGYGEIKGNGTLVVEDPCSTGNADPSPGAGYKPPPDLDMGTSGAVVWGHFVKEVVPDPAATPNGQLCQINQFDPCLPVLVE